MYSGTSICLMNLYITKPLVWRMTLQNYGTCDLAGDADLQVLFCNDFLHQLCIVRIFGKEPPNNEVNLIIANIFASLLALYFIEVPLCMMQKFFNWQFWTLCLLKSFLNLAIQKLLFPIQKCCRDSRNAYGIMNVRLRISHDVSWFSLSSFWILIISLCFVEFTIF